jgi:hypothetical protein
MRLRMTASLLTLLCSWVLWEKWSEVFPDKGRAPVIQAVLETQSLADCRKAMPNFIKEKALGFKRVYKEPEHQILEGPYAAMVSSEKNNMAQAYEYSCLPSTLDPYRR